MLYSIACDRCAPVVRSDLILNQNCLRHFNSVQPHTNLCYPYYPVVTFNYICIVFAHLERVVTFTSLSVSSRHSTECNKQIKFYVELQVQVVTRGAFLSASILMRRGVTFIHYFELYLKIKRGGWQEERGKSVKARGKGGTDCSQKACPSLRNRLIVILVRFGELIRESHHPLQLR